MLSGLHFKKSHFLCWSTLSSSRVWNSLIFRLINKILILQYRTVKFPQCEPRRSSLEFFIWIDSSEWSLRKFTRTSVLTIDSCKLFEMKIQPNLLWIKTKKCFWQKVNLSFLYFLLFKYRIYLKFRLLQKVYQ